jgi:hypothetical protein
MAVHTEDTLGGSSIAQVLNFPLAVSASEALRAEGLFTRQNGQVFNLVSTRATAVGTIAANQRPVSEKQ